MNPNSNTNPNDKPKRKRGRPRTVEGERYMGKEQRAPRKAGGYGGANGNRLYPDDLPISTRDWKPLSEMTPEERRQYKAVKAREYRARKRAKNPLPSAIIRVYAPSDEVAQRIAGYNAVAYKRVTISVQHRTWSRVRNTAWGLRHLGMDITELVEYALSSTLDAYEQYCNDGQPFTEEPKNTSRKSPNQKFFKSRNE